MLSSLLILINIFLFILITKENEINCYSDYNDCFNCSVCQNKENCNCNWDKNSLTCNTGIERTRSYIYEFFSSCTDYNSNSIKNKYCGKTELQLDNNNEIKINIPHNGIYGTSSLFCEYKFTASDSDDVYYTINYEISSTNNINDLILFLIIDFNDKTTISGYLSESSLKREFNKIKEIKLFLYFKKGLNSVPFSFTITKKGDSTKLALYITIGIIILSCLICALIIYLLSKKISENARLRQRTLLELAMARQRGEYNRDDAGSSEASEADIEEGNRKKIDILLKTSLAPQKYNKKMGIKDGNTCTICIEDFKENKSRVSITPCKHVFHYQCLSNWMVKNVMNPKCPNCNFNLIQDVKDSDIKDMVVNPERINVTNVKVNNMVNEENNNNNNAHIQNVNVQNDEVTRNVNVNNNTESNTNTEERNLRTSSNVVIIRRDN